VTTGFLVAGFDRLTINGVLDHILDGPLWFVALAPGVGLTIAAAWLRGPGRGVSPSTADNYLIAFHGGPGLEVQQPIHRIIASVSTLAFGGAMGLEGPSIYMGAVDGSWMHRRLQRFLGNADRNVLMVAGAAAGVAAIFKAPATGAIFALEVPYQDDVARRLLLPALVASASGYLAFVAVNRITPLFAARGAPPWRFARLAGAVGLGIGAGICARGFAWLLIAAKDLHTRFGPWTRVVGAGLVIAALFALTWLLTDEPLAVGVGYRTIDWALDL